MLKQAFDRFQLQEPEITPQGFLKVKGFACRTGILVYQTTDGRTIRVYRPPEEVFKQTTMDSMKNMPLTRQHKGGLVNPKNFKAASVGYTGDTVEKVEGNKLAVDVIVADADAIQDVQNGIRELSMGLLPEWHPTPGTVVIDGREEAYDMIHRNLVANHLSLVNQGRAGAEISLQMDSEDEQAAVMDGLGFQIEKAEDTVKVKINGVEYEVSDQVAQAMKATQDQHDAEIATLKKVGDDAKAEATTAKAATDALTAKVDTMTAEVTKLKGAAQDGTDPAKLNERVKARARVLAVAKHLIDKKDHVALDSKTDLELKTLAVKAHNPAVALDGKSEDYINAAFDMVHQSLAKQISTLDAMGTILIENRTGEQGTVALDEAEVKSMDEMKKKVEDGWMTPKSGCTKDGMISRVKDSGEKIR